MSCPISVPSALPVSTRDGARANRRPVGSDAGTRGRQRSSATPCRPSASSRIGRQSTSRVFSGCSCTRTYPAAGPALPGWGAPIPLLCVTLLPTATGFFAPLALESPRPARGWIRLSPLGIRCFSSGLRRRVVCRWRRTRGTLVFRGRPSEIHRQASFRLTSLWRK